MARTPYATEVYDTPQKSGRVPANAVGFIVIHHAATESFEAVINLELGARQVSSTVIVKDGRAASMFDEAWRAWSLSSQYWDSVSLSSETCNSGGAAKGWPISEASYATLAKIVADWCKRYGIPCNRERIMGHREVYTRYGASYATACPGGINLDRVVTDANAILAGKTKKKESDMIHVDRLVNGQGNAYLGTTRITNDATWKSLDLNEASDKLVIGQIRYFLDQESISDAGHKLAGTVLSKLAVGAVDVDEAALARELAPLIDALSDEDLKMIAKYTVDEEYKRLAT